VPIRGTIPERYYDIMGCRFFNRCEAARPECARAPQPLRRVSPSAAVRCLLVDRPDAREGENA
jgi:oligopeptide/dipeptide ABC transporter ATP-binding protein